MATPVWQPGTIYPPGALVRARSATAVDIGTLDNAGFEDGDLTSWDFVITGGGGTPSVQSTHKFAGTFATLWGGGSGTGPDGGIECELIHEERATVTPGQAISATCYIMYNPGGYTPGSRGHCRIYWYDATDTLISFSSGTSVQNSAGANRWALSTCSGVAPANAATASIGCYLTAAAGDIYVDSFSWNYAFAGIPTGLIFRAVQDTAGYSGSTEPVWPTVLGNQVVDNEVTWEAVATSRVTWEATPILKSGATEPTFPTLPGGSVVDNTIVWEAISRRVEDENCPNSKVVVLAASKIFAADDDIIKFSATVNPLDWTTANDAGYLPFGLKTYGSNPVAVLGLYRANLVAFNSQGFQMWQVDEDPANMAFLDAVPVGSTYPHAWAPVANDLVGLTAVGVRNVGIAGASTNLQADGVGEPIDPLVRAEIRALENDEDVFSLFWPATGQHWTIFGDTAYVLTINGTKKKSWSRYVFPEAIEAWTLDGNTLVLRTVAGKVWEVTDEVTLDDAVAVGPAIYDMTGGTVSPGSSVFSFAYSGAAGIDYDADSPAMIVFISCRTTAALDTPPTSISFGNVVATGIEYMRTSASPQANQMHTALAYIPLRGETPDDTLVRVNWTGVGLEGTAGYVVTTATGISVDSDDFAISLVDTSDAASLEVETVADGDLVLAFGVHQGTDAPTYTPGFTQIATQATFTTNHKVSGGYAAPGEAGTLEIESAVNFHPGFAFVLTGPTGFAGEDFEGIIQWPYLDMGAIGVEKGLVGLDVTCDAPQGVSVSIGWDQKDRTQRTADYGVDEDTTTGQMVPFPVSGPSFDLRLTFAPNQEWEWFAANLYVQDWRMGS